MTSTQDNFLGADGIVLQPSNNSREDDASNNLDDPTVEEDFKWTATKLSLSLLLFVVVGLAEIGGGWLVWQAVREAKPWW